MRLKRDFFARPPEVLARELLGKTLVYEGRRGMITETEAYLETGDEAAHHARGKSAASRALLLGPGTVYIHPMRAYVGMDITAQGGSVLLRGLELLDGLEGKADGPAKLCRAMGITKALYGLNVADADCPLNIEGDGRLVVEIVQTSRIGVKRSVELQLRFHLENSRFSSRQKA